jgi:hypothetical protein
MQVSLSFPLLAMPLMAVSGKSRLLSVGFRIEARHRLLSAGISLIVGLNVSANMFYLLKHILLLNLVIFKLKCNNLNF